MKDRKNRRDQQEPPIPSTSPDPEPAHEEETPPTYPPFDPVADAKSKLIFAAVVFGGLAFVRYVLGWSF